MRYSAGIVRNCLPFDETFYIQGQAAQDYLDQHPLVLTDTEARDLSDAVMNNEFEEVQQMYNNKISKYNHMNTIEAYLQIITTSLIFLQMLVLIH